MPGRKFPSPGSSARSALPVRRGWRWKADVGFQPRGRGLFYVAENSGGKGAQTADITLMRWTGDPQAPFAPVNADQRQQLISTP